MDPFDIIGALRTAATTNGWKFLSGESWSQNYEASKNEYADGQLVLAVEFPEAIPIRNAGALSEISYPGILMLGRKFDSDETPASLDETFIQKYDARLKELTTLLSSFINTFMCANELNVSSENIGLRLNTYDTTIDFVVDTITFVGDGI